MAKIMSGSASDYLSSVRNRDKVLGIVQFAPVALAEPLSKIGSEKLAAAFLKTARVAEGYRTLTRFSGMIDMLSPSSLQSLAKVRDPIMRKVAAFQFFCSFCFFPYEHAAFLATYGVLDESKAGQYAGMAVFFWLYSLLTRTGGLCYHLLLEYPYISPKATDAASVKRRLDFRKHVLELIRTVCFAIFAWSVLPAKGKPQLLANPTGVLYPLHRAVELASPNALNLSQTSRGVLGLVASITEFL